MNWDAFGAISELVGSIALIVTLVYLAIQLRQNTRATRSVTFQAINDGMSRVTEVFATDPELSRILLRGGPGLEYLSPEERVRFSFALMMVMRRLHAVLAQEQFGMVGADFSEAYERSVLSLLLNSRGEREWWSSAKQAFPKAFVKRIDGILASEPLTAPRHLGLADEDSSARFNQTLPSG
jgi:hypothetical protein